MSTKYMFKISESLKLPYRIILTYMFVYKSKVLRSLLFEKAFKPSSVCLIIYSLIKLSTILLRMDVKL